MSPATGFGPEAGLNNSSKNDTLAVAITAVTTARQANPLNALPAKSFKLAVLSFRSSVDKKMDWTGTGDLAKQVSHTLQSHWNCEELAS